MKNKGFTLVELITTFALTAVIVVLLINIIIVIKNLYTKTNLRTQLYINQSNLSNLLNEKINSDNIDSYTGCTDSEFCYVFHIVDGSSIKLIVDEKLIRFGDYTYKLPKKTKVVNPILEKQNTNKSGDSFFTLRIPIVSELYPNIDFGINLVYSENLISKKNIICTAVKESKTGNVPTKGEYNPGDEYVCEVAPGVKYNFFVISTNDVSGKLITEFKDDKKVESVNLILDSNISISGEALKSNDIIDINFTSNFFTTWLSLKDYQDNGGIYTGPSDISCNMTTEFGPITAMNYLFEATKNWTNISDLEINYTDIGTRAPYGGISTIGNEVQITKKDGTIVKTFPYMKARLPMRIEVDYYDYQNHSNLYLYNYLENYTVYDQDYSEIELPLLISKVNPPGNLKTEIDYIDGYWLLDSATGKESTICRPKLVFYAGDVSASNSVYSRRYGVRPVITIPIYNMS